MKELKKWKRVGGCSSKIVIVPFLIRIIWTCFKVAAKVGQQRYDFSLQQAQPKERKREKGETEKGDGSIRRTKERYPVRSTGYIIVADIQGVR